MAKNLIVVESPAKAKTIEKYMGKDYKVLASMGHVRDLPKSTFGVECNGKVDIAYEPIKRATAKKAVTELRKALKESETVWLATDPDREGEAIAWHVAEAAKLPIGLAARLLRQAGLLDPLPQLLRLADDVEPQDRALAGGGAEQSEKEADEGEVGFDDDVLEEPAWELDEPVAALAKRSSNKRNSRRTLSGRPHIGVTSARP